jgi:Cu/Ag efflux pump CusA
VMQYQVLLDPPRIYGYHLTVPQVTAALAANNVGNRGDSRVLHQQASERRARYTHATRQASLLRLRPIMMTALVACLGLLPAGLSTGIGSDTQKPFAIVIVAGLISRLFIGFFVNPVLYEMVARDGDVLQV